MCFLAPRLASWLVSPSVNSRLSIGILSIKFCLVNANVRIFIAALISLSCSDLQDEQAQTLSFKLANKIVNVAIHPAAKACRLSGSILVIFLTIIMFDVKNITHKFFFCVITFASTTNAASCNAVIQCIADMWIFAINSNI